MERYADRSGNSGVAAFETGDDFIRIRFKDGPAYLYTWSNTGRFDVENMKKLARRGCGLATYINRYVRNRYERKEYKGEVPG
jgi:hypothetical protein